MKKFNVLKLTLFAPALVLLAACAGPTTTTLADGSIAYRIDCGKSSQGMNYCFEKAGKSCGAEGYTIYDRQGQAISSSNAATSNDEPRTLAYDTAGNSILIRCGS